MSYRGGGPALIDLIAGQVQVLFEAPLSALPYIKAEKLRALAVSSATRSPVLPDVPTVAETVPGYEATAWFGIGAPKSTPTNLVEKLNQEINAALAEPKLSERIESLGGIPMPMSPSEFGRLIVNETDKWGQTSDPPRGDGRKGPQAAVR